MNKAKSVFFTVSMGSWRVSVDLLKENESCHGDRVYVLNSSPELMLFYGYLDLINKL